MAISARYVGANGTGMPASAGDFGCETVSLLLDGSSTSVAVTLPATSSIKNIYSVVIGGPAALAAGTTFPVAASTGFTVAIIAANNPTNTQVIDLLVFGLGA